MLWCRRNYRCRGSWHRGCGTAAGTSVGTGVSRAIHLAIVGAGFGTICVGFAAPHRFCREHRAPCWFLDKMLRSVGSRFRSTGAPKTASLFPDPGTSFSKPHASLNLIFFVGVKKKTFVFFLTAICGLVKDCFICKTLHFCLDFLICTGFLNLLMCGCLACLFLFCSFKIRPEALSCGFLLIMCGKII